MSPAMILASGLTAIAVAIALLALALLSARTRRDAAARPGFSCPTCCCTTRA
jgi:hypothetical protein